MTILPPLSRLEFFAVSDDRLLCALGNAIAEHAARGSLSDSHLAFMLAPNSRRRVRERR
jgi:hypothetical protein